MAWVQSQELTTQLPCPSHPFFSIAQALAQCDGYLRRMNVVKEAVDDTAGAAQMVARQVRGRGQGAGLPGRWLGLGGSGRAGWGLPAALLQHVHATGGDLHSFALACNLQSGCSPA